MRCLLTPHVIITIAWTLEQEIETLKVVKCSSKLNSSRRQKQSSNPKLEKKILEHKRQH